jgi:hypothetical protein
MTDESIDGREPKLSLSQTLERGAIGIRRHIEVKAPDGRERASIALGLHHDELDSAFPIPAAIFGEQSGPESPPAPLRTPKPKFFMSDDESGTAKPNLARRLTDDLIGLIGDDPQVDQPARPIWQPQLATQKLGHPASCLGDLGADIPHLEVQPSKGEPQIAFQQSVADRSDPLILINHLKQHSFAGRIGASSPLGDACTSSPGASADPLSQGNDDPLRPAHVRHAPDVLVLTDATDQAVAVRSQQVDRRLQVIDFE